MCVELVWCRIHARVFLKVLGFPKKIRANLLFVHDALKHCNGKVASQPEATYGSQASHW